MKRIEKEALTEEMKERLEAEIVECCARLDDVGTLSHAKGTQPYSMMIAYCKTLVDLAMAQDDPDDAMKQIRDQLDAFREVARTLAAGDETT